MAAEKIRNVGPKSAAWLRQVGVRTLDDLRRVGVVETYLTVKRAGFADVSGTLEVPGLTREIWKNRSVDDTLAAPVMVPMSKR